MPITSAEAAEIAARHGLSLGDAAALQRLADTTDEADDLAGQFANVDPLRQFTRKLFDNTPAS